MKFVSGFALTLLLINAACTNKFSKYKNQKAVAQNLINKIIERDLSGIKSLFGVDPNNIGLSDERILIYVDAINQTLKQTNKKTLNKYRYQEYPADSPNLVDIIIPLNNINGCEEFIKVAFVKFTDEDKFYDFEMKKCVPKNFDDLIPPDSLDSSLKQQKIKVSKFVQ